MKSLIDLSTCQPINFNNNSLALGGRGVGRGGKKKSAFTLAEGATHVDIPPAKAKVAFTLVEVLITLGIIGIVAAMTIPTLINKKQKAEMETLLKENYSIIQQSLKMA